MTGHLVRARTEHVVDTATDRRAGRVRGAAEVAA